MKAEWRTYAQEGITDPQNGMSPVCAKPFPVPALAYYQLDSLRLNLKTSQIFSLKDINFEMPSVKQRPFVLAWVY